MLDGFSVGIHLVDVDAGDPGIIRIVVEQIQKIHVSPHIVAESDDLVDDDACLRAFAGDLAEELPQRVWTVRNERVVLDVRGADELGIRLRPGASAINVRRRASSAADRSLDLQTR